MEKDKKINLDEHEVRGYNVGVTKDDLDLVYNVDNPSLSKEEKEFLTQMKLRALKDLETPEEHRVSEVALKDKEIIKLRKKLNLYVNEPTESESNKEEEVKAIEAPKQVIKNTSTLDTIVEDVESDNYVIERDWGSPHDMVELPTRGKIYKGKPKRVKLSYLNGSDEDTLTNQGLLESGLYLKHLIERKILDNNICYEDLSLGDRTAILLWLRATAYGNEYSFELGDPYNEGKTIEHTVDFSELPVTYLDEDTDENGCFTRLLPISNLEVKFRIYTIRDLNFAEVLTEQKHPKLSTEILANQLFSIDGETDKEEIKHILSKLRIKDTRFIRDEITKIEPGVDLELTIASGGKQFKYPFPFSYDFLSFG